MPALTSYTINQLQAIADDIRESIIKMLLKAHSGHSAGPLGMADVFTALYFVVMHHDPKNPKLEDRDRLVLSNGHICPVLYATLAHVGYFKKEELLTLRQFGTRLQGHPNRHDLPGLETSSGPLGQGTSQAVGMALAARMDQKTHEIYCLTGDGELNEGQVWEAFMFAGKEKLHNLTVIIDRNNIQIDGYTEQVMPLEPLRQKLEAFNFTVLEVDGHNIEEIVDACHKAKAIFEKPVAIIAHTIPGHGVDFMEFKPEWHGKTPDAKQAKDALHDLRTLKDKIIKE